ncbi:MAG: serine acetyltransferase [Ignavibacteriales bacterium]|nr:serine acetyltransferase [Ignavibacteriales bacterium]
MSFKKLKYLIYTDFFRITDSINLKTFLHSLIFNEGFKYLFWLRICNFLREKNIFIKIVFYPISKGILRHYTYKYGILIPFTTQIDTGFYIGHFGGIIVNPTTVIGQNCNISQDVTLGAKNRGENIGSPIIGNNVYIGPGVKIFGKITIGNNVAVGANSVVTKDIADNSVVVGIPGKVISDAGSDGYIDRTNYKSFEEF